MSDIKPYGHFTYLVPSDTFGQHPHLVDLLAHHGIGQCDCKDFATRKGPLIKKGGEKEACRCKHIRRALWFHAEQSVQAEISRERALAHERKFVAPAYNTHY